MSARPETATDSRAWRVAVIGLVLAVALPAAALPPPHTVVFIDLKNHAIDTITSTDSSFGVPPGRAGPVAEQIIGRIDGSTELKVDSGISDVTLFGGGFSQSFMTGADAHGYVLARRGSIHVRVSAAALAQPSAYSAPFPGALGTNPYFAYAQVSVSGVLYDIVVPPPTSAAPNPGDLTTLTLTGTLDCADVEPGTFENLLGSGSSINVSLSDDNTTLAAAQSFSGGCASASTNVQVPVGQKFSVIFNVGALAATRAGGSFGASNDAFVNALNTGTMTIVNEDGVGVVGASGVDYGNPDAGPPLTTTSTTTSTMIAPPTTLPSCTGSCGDTVVQPECGESCECPETAPGKVGVDCDAATSIPTLAPSCARCRGCQVDMRPCASTTSTTSTTLPPCTCGDGRWSDDCEDECDCVGGVASCSGADVVPPQQPCAVCTGCALDVSACFSGTVTTTSTTITSTSTSLGGSTTTSSTVASTTPTSTSLPPGPCPAAPRAGCASALGTKASLGLVHDATDPDKDKLAWRWTNAAPVGQGDFGDPTATAGYALCLYDGAGVRRVAAAAPPGGMCGSKPCWKVTKSGFAYKNKVATPDGVTALVLKAGATGKAALSVVGKGAALPVPPLPLTLPLRAQLVRTDVAACWEAVYTEASKNGPKKKKKNGPEKLKAKSAAATP
jgi:hypothetical protein